LPVATSPELPITATLSVNAYLDRNCIAAWTSAESCLATHCSTGVAKFKSYQDASRSAECEIIASDDEEEIFGPIP
jgi:hypothetical protein